MKIYLIQHNDTLNSTMIENRIKNLGQCISYFSKNWLVLSELSSKEIYEKLSIDFEKNSFLIIEVNPKNYFGRMDVKLWDWIKVNKDKTI